jgi:hypothetical protein
MKTFCQSHKAVLGHDFGYGRAMENQTFFHAIALHIWLVLYTHVQSYGKPSLKFLHRK